MITFSGLVLGAIAQAFLDALAGKVTEEILSKLKRDPARNALKQALGAAIRRYAQENLRLELVPPLLQQDGPLTEPSVAEELAQIVRFQRDPDYNRIGQNWRAYLDSPPPWCDFTFEAQRLVKFFQDELRETETFRPVFMLKTLDAIATSSATTVQSLSNIEAQLADLIALMSSRFETVMGYFSRALPGVRDEIRDYTWYIEEKTHDFVGREFIFDEIKGFTEKHPRGYFLVRGDPGAGKTALAAQLVKLQGYVHHFNIRPTGINKTDLFLRNICAQIIACYKLEHPAPTERMLQSGEFLITLLEEVSHKLRANERAIIVVDALDEVDNSGIASGENILYLPITLPQGIYFIATLRRSEVKLRIECEQQTLYIDPDSPGNKADIRKYIEQVLTRPGVQAYIAAQGITGIAFVDILEDKSRGNFMYLRYVLPDIERGIYKDLKLELLPEGLENYYQDHWQRMRGKDMEAWFNYKLPVLMELAAAEYPVSINMIQQFSKVRDRARIVAVLQEDVWGQFLHVNVVSYDGGMQKRYSLYHPSFQDFLLRKDEFEEGVSFIDARKSIISSFTSELFGDEYE